MGEGIETSKSGGMRNWERRLIRKQLQSGRHELMKV